MIRPAKFVDAPALMGLLRGLYARSKYAGRVEICEKALENTVLGLIGGMNQPGPSGTHVSVSEEDGKVVGFIAGALSRVYGIGDKLGASDVFLVNEGRATGAVGLIDAYIAWASANPKVIEIGLSWADTLPDASRVAAIYERKGFYLAGELYVLPLDAKPQEIAA